MEDEKVESNSALERSDNSLVSNEGTAPQPKSGEEIPGPTSEEATPQPNSEETTPPPVSEDSGTPEEASDTKEIAEETSEQEEAPSPEDSDPVIEDAEEESPVEPGIFDELYSTIFGRSWEMWVGAIILSVLSITLFLISSPWGSSGGLNNFGQNFYDLLGMDFPESASRGVKDIADYRYALLSLTMLLGAMGSALMSKEFAIRVPPKGELAKGLVGGVLMGTGAVIGMGCTVGGFYSAWPALSASGLIFALGLFIGVYAAVRYLLWEMEAHPGWSSGKSCTYLAAKTEGMSYQPLAGIIVLAIGASIALFYDSITDKVLIGFILIGLIIGVVLQRSRFCIVRALREPFISGDADPALAIMGGIIIGLIGFTVIKVMGLASESDYVAASYWFPAIVGGVIFGVGMTVAGGCTVGATWRAAEGHVKLWMALIGLVLSMPLVGEYIKPGFLDMLPDSMNQAVFLPDTLGYGGSISLILLVIVIWFIFVKWNERTGKFTAF